ncbi:MAG: peptidase M14 [Planctomycetes bacterium]|nr:peptidase M14 [Planctomycetota bacterium]
MPTVASLVVPFVLAAVAVAQVPEPDAAPKPLPFAPGVTYDPAIPTLEQVTGHAPGAEVSSHADVERYLRALAAASPRIRLVDYGASWEGRTLWYAIVGAPVQVARAGEIQAAMQRLADPRGMQDGDVEALIADLPAVGWLANCVHGDEPSGTDAALLVLYHLLAAQNDPVVDKVLAECLVLIDPLQNPDGRDRFVHSTRAARGRFADATPLGAEHSQPWPGGRSNHALFDMNRDWFALSQPETQARVRAFLAWWPLVYVDLHEMGGDSTYYFPPPAAPVHGEITAGQRAWLSRYGRNNARWFDRFGFDYFTREAYDSFYPGYGEGWPTFHGSIGMTFEMASARGLVFRRRDDSLLWYRDGVHRHFVASMATLETLANGRAEAQRSFVQHRRAGIARGEAGPIKEYVFPDTGDRTRLARLANLLLAQGIEVQRATGELRASAVPLGRPAAEAGDRTFAAGAYVVSLAQPASTLAHVLLEPHFDMDRAFVDEQKRREARRLGTEFYDLTAWSLPLLFGVEAWATTAVATGDRAPLGVGAAASGAAPLRAQPPQVAYVVAWGQNGAAALLAELLRLGVKVRSLDRAFTLDGVEYPAGSYVIRVHDQPDGLHARLAQLAAAHGVTPYCADSSWIEQGISLGSGHALALKVPRVVMAWDRPVNPYSAGWVRYLLEQRYGVPVTPVRTHQLDDVELDRFTVLILPEADGYGRALGERGIAAVKGFVERGGVLVTFGSATRWLCEKEVGLLASEAEPRVKPEAPKPKANDAADAAPEAKPDAPFDYGKAIRPDKEAPPAVPGAILRVTVDPDHWLGFGYRGSANVVHDSSHVFTPVKLDRGTNVAIYAEAEQLVLAGFVWDESRRLLPQKAFLVHQPHGKGHVVAFAEDPNVRAFADGLNLFLLNAVLLTAGR